ncbi:MAG TPA: cytochrome c biogenesis protein CcsA [Thermomicrobiales bacterium]|nr:cytochrome c biogenesis protein CcsA [Thermomicrobiales bacterium]HQZ89828.1 cytochrome c biogenesis protein CcsA [Thermomicrobiales bacterium]HRA30446.1 cytochrome c biogenesis protein CcsA [Thermomicrobiales bacterium]
MSESRAGQTARARKSDLKVQALGAVTVAVLTIGIFMAFVYAPMDSVQGQAQRIFYVHVPMAWLSYLAFGVIFVGSVGYLWKRNMRWDRLARSGAELGFLFTTLVLITGSLWGRPIWNTFWTWDARLTTTLILWFIYLGYFMIRSYAADAERGARYAAVLGIIGAVDVPIIHLSVQWWRTLHPQPVVLNTGGPNLPNEMLWTLLVCFTGFTLLFVYLLIQKIRIEVVRDRLADREMDALLAPQPAALARAGEVSGGSEA